MGEEKRMGEEGEIRKQPLLNPVVCQPKWRFGKLRKQPLPGV
jgi:hypothetical protein